jgi:hypothetical protein
VAEVDMAESGHILPKDGPDYEFDYDFEPTYQGHLPVK